MGVCFLFLTRTLTEGRYCDKGAESLQLKNNPLMKKRTFRRIVRISVRVEVKRVVKVKAYQRIRRGKVEKVRTHYRRY